MYTRICQIVYFYDNVHLHKNIKYISKIEIYIQSYMQICHHYIALSFTNIKYIVMKLHKYV